MFACGCRSSHSGVGRIDVPATVRGGLPNNERRNYLHSNLSDALQISTSAISNGVGYAGAFHHAIHRAEFLGSITMINFRKFAKMVLSFLILGWTVRDLNAHTFYVSPEGNDDNPGTESRPFQTIGKAQLSVRAINREMAQNISVFLRGGNYAQSQPLVFDSDDSGSNGYCVIYKNYANETPLISGGRKITEWQQESSTLWKAKVAEITFRQLYVNGRRAVRAKGGLLPDAELYGNSGYKTTDAQMAKWAIPEDVELIYDVQWQRCICKVGSVTPVADGAILSMLEPYFTILRLKDGPLIEKPSYIENALELLDEPGEWYLNKNEGWLYYMPREGEQLDHCEVIVPALEDLLVVRGTLDQPVHDLRFEGIAFSHATWNQPSVVGHIDLQANFTLSQQNLILRFGAARSGAEGADALGSQSGKSSLRATHSHNEAIKSRANVTLHSAQRIHFERCTFSKLGGAGIDLEYGARDNIVCGCTFRDISGSAIQVGDVVDHHPTDARMIVANNHIVNNVIRDVAAEYLSGVGIFVGYTDGTRVANNEISHLPYSGVSMGWGWGEADAGGGGYWQPFFHKEPTVCKNNVCEKNHIHHIMQRRWDGAGVYTLGNMPGSVIRGNHIHDSVGLPGGIYLDEGSGFIEVTGNVVYKVPEPVWYNNRCQDRINTCKVHDNSFLVTPEESNFQRVTADEAGLQPAYRDLLRP